MHNRCAGALLVAVMSATAWGQSLSPEIQAKVEVRAKQLAALASDPALVAAVRSHNAAPPAESASMTNEKWKELTVLDPTVRGFSKNAAGTFLKAKRDDSISEMFVSAADGAKVGFLSKPSSWSHKGKPKHQVPMSGKTWIGPLETDESSGLQQVQVAVPVMDSGRPIGSLVVGLKLASLK